MKKSILSIWFITRLMNPIAAQNITEEIVKYFKPANLPIETRRYMDLKRGDTKILPNDLVLKFLYKNDTNQMKYFFENIDMETQNITFSGYLKYVVSAAEYYNYKNSLFLTYERSKMKEESMYYLAILSKEGYVIDSLLVLSSESAYEFVDWICSKIFGDKIYIFHYTKDNKKKLTQISVVNYIVDTKTNKFVRQKEETFESKCGIEDFYAKREKCIQEDPYYKY